ncbi:MAG: glycosyl hydrolase, partial [Limisphaerales bacterium]
YAKQTPATATLATAWTPDWAPGQDPKAILVDRMGDWDADLIYQDPASPYARTEFAAPGSGRYLKLTLANGSPYVWCEMNGMRYGQVFNLIEGLRPGRQVTAPAAVPGLPDVQYALITGNQDDPQRGYPGVEAVPSQLNPAGAQNNFTTAAVFWHRVNPRAGGQAVGFATGTSPLGLDYLQLDFGADPGKVFFTVALLPVQAHYPAAGQTNDLAAARAYAEALGQYAFNFVAGTKLTYSVAKKSVATSTWTTTLRNPYANPALVAAANTVQSLLPHQYQPMQLGTNLAGAAVSWTPLVPESATAFAPALPGGSAPLRYWSARGGHLTILGTPAGSGAAATTSFQTKHLHNNFLAALPPPRWTNIVRSEQPLNAIVGSGPGGDTVQAVPIGSGPKEVTVGQFLMDDLATQYMNNTAYGNAPWGVFFHRNSIDSYGVNAALSRVAQQLGTLQLFDQYAPQAARTYVDEFWYNAPGPSPFYRAPDTNRPGVNPAQALHDTVAGLQLGLSSLFAEKPHPVVVNFDYWAGGQDTNGVAVNVPIRKPNLWNLEYFVRWEPEAGRVLMHPNGAFPAFFWTPRSTNMAPPVATTFPAAPPQPQREVPPLPTGAANVDPPQNIPTDQSSNPYHPGTMWDGFGIASQFNDHHYNLGYLIAAASLTSIYDNSWLDQPAASEWAKGSGYGAGIDAIIQTLGNDPDNAALQSSLHTADEMRTSFPKFSFFDTWAGHPWASGITPGPGLQVMGLNENSNYEGNQAWSATTLWGMATDRPAVTDLGIFLYTLGSWSGDFYLFDKNGNQVPGNPWSWVPVTTGTDTNNGGIYVPGLSQHAANPLGGRTQTPVGTATMYQGGGSLANFFGGFPQGSRLIQAFPAAPWHLAMGRNTAFMRNWSAALASPEWQALNVVVPDKAVNFKAQYMAALDQVVALGGTDRPSAAAPFADPTGSLPLPDYWANLYVGDRTPPWAIGATGQSLLQPSQTVGSMYHWLLTLDQYGLPDFTLVGHGVTNAAAPASSPDAHVFTAAFTKVVDGLPVASFFAFNPGTQPVMANFWNVTDTAQTNALVPGGGLLVQPKRWARAQVPPGIVEVHSPDYDPVTKKFTFVVDVDHMTVLLIETSPDLVNWLPVPVPPHDPAAKKYTIDLGDRAGGSAFFRITTLDN